MSLATFPIVHLYAKKITRWRILLKRDDSFVMLICSYLVKFSEGRGGVRVQNSYSQLDFLAKMAIFIY